MSTSQTALWFLNTRVRIVVPSETGEDRLSVLEHTAPFGDSPPMHVHDTEDELFHLLEGDIRFSVGGRTVEITAGETVLAPKGVPHSYVVESAGGARWLTVTRPGDFEAMVRELSRPATAAGLPEPSGPPTPEMAAHLAEICARHGIRLVGEPLHPRQPVRAAS